MYTRPQSQYLSLMKVVRNRLDIIASLRNTEVDKFIKAETAAFHGRKIVEAIAFGCVVAVENGLKFVPKDAKGKWNAGKIFKSLERRSLNVFPGPSVIKQLSAEEQKQFAAKAVIEGVPERVLAREELISIYQRLHKWNHELNPYVDIDRESFVRTYELSLWNDLAKINNFIERHLISQPLKMS